MLNIFITTVKSLMLYRVKRPENIDENHFCTVISSLNDLLYWLITLIRFQVPQSQRKKMCSGNYTNDFTHTMFSKIFTSEILLISCEILLKVKFLKVYSLFNEFKKVFYPHIMNLRYQISFIKKYWIANTPYTFS